MSYTKIFLLIISIIIIIICIYFSKDFRIDSSSDTLIQKNDQSFKYYQYYNEIFPSKKFLVLAVKSSKKINEEYIESLNLLNSNIKKIKNINSTFSIVDAPILLLNNLSLSDLTSREMININNSKDNLNLILKEFSTSPLYKDQIINIDQNISSIIIYIKDDQKLKKLKKKIEIALSEKIDNSKLLSEYREEKNRYDSKNKILINEIRSVINNHNNKYQYFLGGIDMISNDTIDFVKNDIVVFSFAVLFLIIIVLLIIYRDIKWVIIPLLSTIYSVLLMFGFLGIMKWEITAISSNFISLMLILSISMNIHIINNYRMNYLNEKNNLNLRYTLKKIFLPCFYTTLTTIVAFGSLLFSKIKPIIDFGNIMIIALSIILITSFTILPLLISFFPTIKESKIKFSILEKFSSLAITKSNKVLILNFILFIISIFGIYNLNVENSFINYFKSDTEIHKGMKLIDTELGGTTPIDILIEFNEDHIIINKENDSEKNENNDNSEVDIELEFENDLFEEIDENTWFTEEKIRTIKKIHKYLEAKNEIGKVQSIYSLIEMANLINKNELSIFELSILYKEIPDEYRKDLIDPFLSLDKNLVKISARIKDSQDIKRDKLIKDIQKFISLETNNIKKLEINGMLVLYNNMLQSLFDSQIKSFGIVLLSIFIMFMILFKSIKLSIIGIIPNIIASFFILGLIGLLKIPLDIMTITIAAITIGIAVDNTIHYIYRIKEKKNSQEMQIINLINKTHRSVGFAVLTTSLTISLGFSVLILSNFIPTILFGIFTSLAMIIAMLGVLITLPSLLVKYYN